MAHLENAPFAVGHDFSRGTKDRLVADNFPQRLALGQIAGEIEQFGRLFIDQHDALPRVGGDNAFVHAGDDREQFAAFLGQLGKQAIQRVGHGIQRGGQHADFTVAAGQKLAAHVSPGNGLGKTRKFADGRAMRLAK